MGTFQTTTPTTGHPAAGRGHEGGHDGRAEEPAGEVLHPEDARHRGAQVSDAVFFSIVRILEPIIVVCILYRSGSD